MRITKSMIDDASYAVGYRVGPKRFAAAMAAYQSNSLAWIKQLLADQEKLLAKLGGRGVELADEIDDLRIAIAAREAAP